MKQVSNETKLFALGGLGEVGKNMFCLMHQDEIIIIDAGVMFPEDNLLGIDYVIPDFTFLLENKDKIKGLFITHGHEDHIGGIPFLLNKVDIPRIYASKLALELIKVKLEDRKINYKNITEINSDTKVKFKHFEVNFFRTSHSIPDSYGIAITTPNGVVVQTGDFKFDLTPIGPMADLHKMAEIGKNGVKLLLSDSTNVFNEGFSSSESKVDEALGEMISKAEGRIIIATFASNVYRLKHIIETCKEFGKKIVIFGRSMENNITIAMKSGYIDAKNIIISAEQAKKMPSNEIVLLCTGSQGEPLAALTRIASGTHKQIQLMPDDVVIFSSSAIPGNASSIAKTINKLYLKGVEVYTTSILSDLHTTGHGSEEELKLMLRLMNPEYFLPFHGEYRMLKKHIDLACECNIPKENCFLLENGDVLAMTNEKIIKNGKVVAGDVYVDGSRVGDIGSAVIRDRKIMSSDGILLVIINVDMDKKIQASKPLITTRGFVMVNENEKLIKKIEKESYHISQQHLSKNNFSIIDLKNDLIIKLTPFIMNETGRKPIILPVIMSIKK